MIPKVIHYCWFGGKPIPQEVKACIRSWNKYCPDYKIIRWDEKNFDVTCVPFVKEAYENQAWAFVSDYARLKIVYENGGIYLDTDVELLKSFDSLLKLDSFFGRQQSGEINTGLGFGAKAKSPVLKYMLAEYDNVQFEKNQLLKISCPLINTKAIDSAMKDGVFDSGKNKILPPEYMDPLASGKNARNLMSDLTISVHHYSASWTSNQQRLKRRSARIIGEETIIKIKSIIGK